MKIFYFTLGDTLFCRSLLAAIANDLFLIKGVGTDYHGWLGRDKPFIEATEEPRILLDILKNR